jgi:hypothetical protein
MGKFGKLAMLSTARKAARRNAGQVHEGIDRVASTVRGRIGTRHADKVDKGASLAKRVITGTDGPSRRSPATG